MFDVLDCWCWRCKSDLEKWFGASIAKARFYPAPFSLAPTTIPLSLFLFDVLHSNSQIASASNRCCLAPYFVCGIVTKLEMDLRHRQSSKTPLMQDTSQL